VAFRLTTNPYSAPAPGTLRTAKLNSALSFSCLETPNSQRTLFTDSMSCYLATYSHRAVILNRRRGPQFPCISHRDRLPN